MKIELKNVRIVKQMSEETTAFTASIWIDGKRVGEASNRGHGDPILALFDNRETGDRFRAYCKTLPPVVEEWGTLEMDGELFLAELVEQHAQKQWMMRQTRNKVLFRVEGDDSGAYRTIKVVKGRRRAVVEHIREKYGKTLVELH